MAKFGYKLMSEEHGPSELVGNAIAAEAAGFDFVAISDHFHPWVRAQGHSPFAWSVLGAIAHVTKRVGIATGLTCPILRYHPAIIAQAAATIAVMSEGRFTLAVGAGERLNEHVTGAPWPSVAERHAMLGEAVDIFRELWAGKARAYEGDYFVLDHAEIFDLPRGPIPVVLGVSGDKSVALASAKADGIMATEPNKELVADFRKAKGSGSVWGEVALGYAPTEAEGRRLTRERFAFSALGWSVNAELPSVEGFEAATRHVREEDLADAIPVGPDPQVHLKAIRKFIDAGFDHIALLGIGPDQSGFIRFAENELLPKLK